jgi:threonine/homoserine/homoserine lactone efflux protein
MEQFPIVATVHFLALLSPDPGFFLVARTAITAGWRTASGACIGIAVGNGVFIAAAFAGLAALRTDSAGFIAIHLAGCIREWPCDRSAQANVMNANAAAEAAAS